MRTLVRGVLAAVVLASTIDAQSARPSPYRVPPALDDGWRTASADSVGVDSSRLAALTESVGAWSELGVHAILIERSGRLIYEEYFDGFDQRLGQPLGRVSMTRSSMHDVRSISKSVVSALFGIALGSGAIESLDESIIRRFAEYDDLDADDRRRITLAHALSMTSGLAWNENLPYTDPANDAIRMTHDSEPYRFVLARPFAANPGTTFNYNSGLAETIGRVLERATGSSLQEFARTRLFEPLGIKDFEWAGNLAGRPEAASGLRLHPRDLAKFGSLFVHSGQWNGRQIVPADWVAASTHRQFRFPPPEGPDAAGQYGYGYFWWYFCYPSAAGLLEVRTAYGNGQQWLFVLPGLDMVVTILAGRYDDVTTGSTLGTTILRDHVIPAVRTGVEAGCPNS
jgi:CubicO group peptidase (beta-lactamase class C family)